MKKALWTLPTALALAVVGCELINTETDLIYEVVFYNVSGIETGHGQLELEYSDPTRDSDLRSITGRWKWDYLISGLTDSGPLVGVLKKNGDIWIDFQLYLYAIDTGLDLEGRFISGIGGDFSGHVYKTGIYGRRYSGWTFRAVLK